MAITLDGTNGITTPALENEGVTTVAAGSASAPAITTDGDTNTGIFFPAADTIAFAEGSTEVMRLDSSANLQFNSGYGSVATAYGCRAWVNFAGNSNSANLTGTYSQTGTTVTVTITNHGYITGNSAYLDFTSGTAVDGVYTVTVVNANTFEVTQASRTTSGNVTDRRNPIRGSGNITSIADEGTGAYAVNFTTAMPDENYAIAGSVSSDVVAVSLFYINGSNTVLTTTTAKIVVVNISATAVDRSYIGLAFFR
jgi:hypothetical protein